MLRNIPNVIEEIWQTEISTSGKTSFNKIILTGSEVFCTLNTILQSYLKSIGDFPVIIDNQDDQIVSTETLLLIYYNANEEDISLKSQELMVRFPKCKIIILSPDPLLINETIQEKIDILYVKELKARPNGFEILFPLIILIAVRHGIIPDCSNEISTICLDLKNFIEKIDFSNPIVKNPAKRMAGQMADRLIVIVGSEFLSQVAKFWKDQINSVSKSWAQYELISEIKNNTLKSVHFPERMLSNSIFVFLNSNLFLPKVKEQISKTKLFLLSSGVGTDEIQAHGDSILSQIFNMMVFGEYVAYFLAILYGVDPSFELFIDF